MIVAFGTYDSIRHPRVGIIIDGLRANGVDVTELNRPLGFSTSERVRMLREPWRLPAFGFRLLSRWISLIKDARALRREGAEPSVVLVGYLGHFDVILARRVFRRSTIVLDHLIFAGDTAQDRGTEGLRVRMLRWLDSAAIRSSDLVLVDTTEHEAMLPAGVESLVIPVGAREEWFVARPSNDELVPLPSVVFFGLFTPLQGAPVIAAAIAQALDDGAKFTATMIGTGQDWDEARSLLGDRQGVTWIDWVEASELPKLVAGHDVGLGIFGTGPKALRVVPNKVYEAAAAGCAVLTSDTPPQRALLGDGAIYAPPGDARALASALVKLTSSGAETKAARIRAREAAEQFRAARVVAPLLTALARRA
ncbi:glycosyltransferase [Microbacterium marmarense]|uniref:Glycosyltransferase n=1 Tax=Microbacterium marmarense TaxID=3122051 RepID=A0ABU8LYC1_9MICO